jgi:hypothetical protein
LPDVTSSIVKRILVASGVLALAGALAPWNGSAGAIAPAQRLDTMIRLQGDHHWVGKGVYGPAKSQRVTGVLRSSPGRVVALIRSVNTGTETGELDVWASSIRDAFYGGAHWPSRTSLAPGESVTFRYVAHRGSAEDGDSMPVDIAAGNDGVRLLLEAR